MKYTIEVTEDAKHGFTFSTDAQECILIWVTVFLLMMNYTAAAQTQSGAIWGLCIGISEYEPDVLTLNWANKDAIEFCTSFLRHELGVPENHYDIIKDREATRDNILKKLAWLAGSADEGDRVYLFYSGHGKPSSPILPHDSEKTISLEEIKNSLRKIYARDVIVFADACHSGRIAGKGAKTAIQKAQLTGLSKGLIVNMGQARTNLLIMTSAKGIQEAYEMEGQKNGLFTYYLMKALMDDAGRPLLDRNQDSQVSVYELYEYVFHHVTQDSDQEPQLSDSEQAKHMMLMPVSVNAAPSTQVVFPTPTPVPAPAPAKPPNVNAGIEQRIKAKLQRLQRFLEDEGSGYTRNTDICALLESLIRDFQEYERGEHTDEARQKIQETRKKYEEELRKRK